MRRAAVRTRWSSDHASRRHATQILYAVQSHLVITRLSSVVASFVCGLISCIGHGLWVVHES